MMKRFVITGLFAAVCATGFAEESTQTEKSVWATPMDSTTVTATDKAKLPTSLPKEIHWFRNSSEYRACAIQTYKMATQVVEAKAKDLTSGTWAVILDADETVLDNSQFQKELGMSNKKFDPKLWDEWVMRGEAGLIPGAKAFTDRVRELGGIVAIVTNRNVTQQKITEDNLKKVGVYYDLIYCKSGESFKEERFKKVEEGDKEKGIGPLKVIMNVGDNIQDFPKARQTLRNAADEGEFKDFGDIFIVLPNPMYGSWERNPQN
ncbi:MAG: hypothetical protein K1X53_14340 [Candidatus Sumerlaeaceae bacterium]|nr:hypothetical protein [Candidatus Sumerlaeaceae bacterium]